jgi:chorismate mutase-like protein
MSKPLSKMLRKLTDGFNHSANPPTTQSSMKTTTCRFSLMILLALCLIGQTGYVLAAQDPQLSGAQSRLVDEIITRLQISRDVAWTKFQNHSPVIDLPREAAVLKGMKSQGEKMGLTDKEVTSYFQSQILASRLVQEELISGWKSGSPQPPTPPKDLQKEIRPLLIKVSLEMLATLKEIPSQSFSTAFQQQAGQRILAGGFSQGVADLASTPLGNP